MPPTGSSERIRAAGGEAEIQERGGRPLVIGRVAASTGAEAPTVLAYAHLDVQPPDPLELWESDPWTLVERNGSLVARGVADDKAHLYMLLEATRLLAAAGELPVNVRFAIDAEEEVGGRSVIDWVDEDAHTRQRGARCSTGATRPRRLPSFCTALRGMCYFHVTVRTGERDLHSGVYGGAALTATHALMQTLAAVLPGPDGRLPEPLRAGIVAPTEEELAGWSVLPPGAEELASDGARPERRDAPREEFYLRTTAEPSVDVNGIESGSPRLQKTVLPVEADANVSMRLAPGQTTAAMAPVFERLLREAAPEGATVDVELWSTGEPAYVDPEAPAIVARAGRVRARARRPAGARPLGRLDPGRGLPRRARRARDRHRVRASDGPDALPERAHPGRGPARRARDDGRAVPPVRRAWLTLAIRARSRRSSPRTCSSASCATSCVDTQSDPTSTTYPSTAKQLDLSRLLVEELRQIGLDDVELTEHGIRVRHGSRHASRGRRPSG